MGSDYPNLKRRFQVFAPFKKADRKIFEPVSIDLGFRGSVDSDSGMILNLVEIDSWIEAFKKKIIKKSYFSYWDFCKANQARLQKIIGKRIRIEVEFIFQEFFVIIQQDDIYFGWRRNSVVKKEGKNWLSPVKLTMKSLKKKWPPISAAHQEQSLNALNEIDFKNYIQKLKGNPAEIEFFSFEYFDLVSNSRLRIQK